MGDISSTYPSFVMVPSDCEEGGSSIPKVLARNAACHECRRRKLVSC